MKYFTKLLFLLLLPVFSFAQKSELDSLHRALRSARVDSGRYTSLTNLVTYYTGRNSDSSLYYAAMALEIAVKNKKAMEEAGTLDAKGYDLMLLNRLPESLQAYQQALQLAEDPENEKESATWNKDFNGLKTRTRHNFRLDILAGIQHDYGHLLGVTNNTDEQIAQYRLTGKLAREVGDKPLLSLVHMNLGAVYMKLNRLDSALLLENDAEQVMKRTGYQIYIFYVYITKGEIYSKKRNTPMALLYYHKAVATSIDQKNAYDVFYSYSYLANYYLSVRQKDSSLYYAKKELETLQSMHSKDLAGTYEDLYKSYNLTTNRDSAYKYSALALIGKDSSFKTTIKSLTDFQQMSFKSAIHAQELEKEKSDLQARIRTYILLAAIGVLLLLAGLFYWNNRQKQKANVLLNWQKEEVQTALVQLKSTQTQLIQYEKMASLGELTAGIAHEIQNPLNFVNNFSDVNTELLDEMQQEIDKGDYEEVKAIAVDIRENQVKISAHGRRADFIVKGMLQHSRTSTGERQLTNVNQLADEFLKLSYHGLRAKDKSFNAELTTRFQPDLPKVNLVAQDIGRVLLNLFNNAFYAVNKKKKTAGEEYKPEITVSTYPEDGFIVIKVKDNGTGIPNAIKEKIMQPFFTTKPTGEGTGLGLSLSYDVVVKGHGGTLELFSREGEGSEFVVKLPVG
jgi:two-component system NtrC family sensor kinase